MYNSLELIELLKKEKYEIKIAILFIKIKEKGRCSQNVVRKRMLKNKSACYVLYNLIKTSILMLEEILEELKKREKIRKKVD